MRNLPARGRMVLMVVAALAAVALVALAAVALGWGDRADTPAAPTTGPLAPTTSRPAPTTSPAGLATLEIAEWPADLPRYDRDRFELWVDADGDGCNTRDEVLIAESLDLPQIDPFRCDVVAGRWVDAYSGSETTNPGDLQIDHLVALANAWRSGAWAWDDARRQAFANDLDHPGALNAVPGEVNQAKADKGPEAWRPPDPDAWCRYALDWAQVKAAWGLTATRAEWDALVAMAATCPAD
ncbi:MAG: HNH endonuclease [Acidimicrobiales bacterium]|nr:HNH endonuclease [Acidimicrobiales bacterium]